MLQCTSILLLPKAGNTLVSWALSHDNTIFKSNYSTADVLLSVKDTQVLVSNQRPEAQATVSSMFTEETHIT